MLIPLIVITLLIASAAAIYFILKSMGEDGVEAAAPGSCKSGRCGVRNNKTAETACHTAEESDPFAGTDGSQQKPRFLPGDETKADNRP